MASAAPGSRRARVADPSLPPAVTALDAGDLEARLRALGLPRYRCRQVRDAVFRRILHLPVDDPYLGLAEVLAPGTPAGIRALHPELDKG